MVCVAIGTWNVGSNLMVHRTHAYIKFRINEGVDNQFTIYHRNYIFLPVMVVVVIDSRRSRYNDCYRVISLRSSRRKCVVLVIVAVVVTAAARVIQTIVLKKMNSSVRMERTPPFAPDL